MKQAILYDRQNNHTINCHACNHHCIISDNKLGFCNVRKNINGILYSLNYGKVIAQHVDPIEKKPLYNFLPGTKTYSLATIGCNFKCLHCQNADISQIQPNNSPQAKTQTPQDIINAAIKNNCHSIAYTYTEPTIFVEFALACMILAHKQGLKNIWVSNGYFTEKTFAQIKPYLDAINIDLKFFNKDNYQKICRARLEPILNNLKLIAKSPVHLEITTLIIPTINDSEIELKNIARFIADLSQDIPWHVTAFYPAYKMTQIKPTTKAQLALAHQIGKNAGLNYVYAGNIIEEGLDNTYCPYCNELLIDRIGNIVQNKIVKNKCPKCEHELAVIL